MMEIPGKEALEAAQYKIAPYIHRTPVMHCKTLDKLSEARLFFKCENMQKIGAFKARGATNALLSLPGDGLKKGVATHSSGNHAQAVAWAASLKGIPAYIVMPRTAPDIKKKAVRGYGAKIITCEPTQTAREATLKQVVEDTGAQFIHPYDDYRIIAGQATAAMELIEDHPDLDVIFTPVGGGGLLSGTILAAKYFGRNLKVYAGEPRGADDAHRSLQAGKILPSINPDTIADGLLTSLGERTFEIIKQGVEAIVTVSDGEIIHAMRLIWERMKIIVEPSGAVPLAAVLQNTHLLKGKKVGIILSGGNVNLNTFFEGLGEKTN